MVAKPDGMQKPYGITMEGRERASVTGVTSVESFDDATVILNTHGGRLTISGSGLKVSNLQVEEGRLTLEGELSAAVYAGKKRPHAFWKRALGR
ncbi:MAG: sporulation protein YabP [Clostridiales bacterium]|nr:sporulation protein YabP [Clostridiales bacterium]